jgi:hypothetical protein
MGLSASFKITIVTGVQETAWRTDVFAPHAFSRTVTTTSYAVTNGGTVVLGATITAKW